MGVPFPAEPRHGIPIPSPTSWRQRSRPRSVHFPRSLHRRCRRHLPRIAEVADPVLPDAMKFGVNFLWPARGPLIEAGRLPIGSRPLRRPIRSLSSAPSSRLFTDGASPEEAAPRAAAPRLRLRRRRRRRRPTASFTVIAAPEPTIIKIDKEIVQGVGNKDAEAKKALSRRSSPSAAASEPSPSTEGSNRRDLLALQDREVDFPLPARPVVLHPCSAAARPRYRRLTLVSEAVSWDRAVRPRSGCGSLGPARRPRAASRTPSVGATHRGTQAT